MRRMIEVKEYANGEVVINDGLSVNKNGDVTVGKNLVVDGAIASEPALKTSFIIGADTKEGSVTCNEIIVRDGIVYFHIHAFKDASVANAYTTDLFQFPVGTRPEKNHGFVIVKQSAIGTSAGFARDTEGHCNFYGWTASTEQEYDLSGCFILPEPEEVLLSMNLNHA